MLNFLRETLNNQLSNATANSPQDAPMVGVLKGMLQTQKAPVGELKPAYMVSLQNLAELDATLQKIAADSGIRDLYSDFRSSAESWGGNFLDTDRKSGFVLMTDGASTFPMLFVPLKPGDAAAHEFLTMFGAESARPGIVIPREKAGYRWVFLGDNPYVRFPQGTVVVQKGNWGYFVPQTLIPFLPDDPLTLLPQTEGKYLLSDYVYMDGLPRRLGNGLLSIGELIVLFSDPKKAKFGPEQKEMLAGLLGFGRVLVNEVETIFRGVKRNDATGEITLETAVHVVPGGQLSQYIDRQSQRQTVVRAFFQPDGALYAGIIADEMDANQKRTAHALVRYLFRDIETKMIAEQQQFAEQDAEKAKQQADEAAKAKAEAQAQAKDGAKTPGELTEAFSGAVGQFVGGTWDKSLTTALRATKDQLEIESVHKFEAIAHNIVERGVVEGAITVRPGGNTVGAFSITEGEKIVAILTGAQLKINTDPRAAHLKGKVFFNTAKQDDFRISTIALPIKDMKGTENYPASLREKAAYVNFGIREDRFCFTAGFDPDLLDVLKKAMKRLDEAEKLPETTLVFSPYHFGKLLEPYAAEMPNPNTPELVKTLLQADPQTQLTYTAAYGPSTYYSTLVVPKVMITVLGLMRNDKNPTIPTAQSMVPRK